MSVNEEATTAKLSQLLAEVLKKGKRIVEYSSRFPGLVAELENAGRVVSEVEKKRAILRRVTKDYDINYEEIMSLKHPYSEAVSKLIVSESRLQMTDDVSPLALITRARSQPSHGNASILVSRDI